VRCWILKLSLLSIVYTASAQTVDCSGGVNTGGIPYGQGDIISVFAGTGWGNSCDSCAIEDGMNYWSGSCPNYSDIGQLVYNEPYASVYVQVNFHSGNSSGTCALAT
jgi:hypothetical protein